MKAEFKRNQNSLIWTIEYTNQVLTSKCNVERKFVYLLTPYEASCFGLTGVMTSAMAWRAFLPRNLPVAMTEMVAA